MRPVSGGKDGSRTMSWVKTKFYIVFKGTHETLDSHGRGLFELGYSSYMPPWPDPKDLTQIFVTENIGLLELANLEGRTQDCSARWIWLRFFLVFLAGCGGPE